MVRKLVCLVCVFLCYFVYGASKENILLGVNGEKIASYRYDGGGLSLFISGEYMNFPQFQDCSQMGLYLTEGRGEVAVDGSCHSRGGQIDILLMRMDIKSPSWCIERMVDGEYSADVNSSPFPSYQVLRLADCKVYKDENSKIDRKQRVSADFYKKWLGEIAININASNMRVKYLRGISYFDAAELAQVLEPGNVELLNNFAFYLQREKKHRAAGILLTRIVEQFPDRVVAKLNLADSLWDEGFQAAAARHYVAYREQMLRLGLTAKVPSRVSARAGR